MRDTKLTSKIMAHIRSKGGKTEMALGKAMWALGLRYRKNVKSLVGTPDFVLKKYRTIVFCDGDFWHGRDFDKLLAQGRFKNNEPFWIRKMNNNILRDREVNRKLSEAGWNVIRLWESDIVKDIQGVAERVSKQIKI